ncbi:MAG: hypothetical protein F6J87_12795 [Spirulina sp. SIO3F2]|nr:hypothetical protein [Spirulina sp. SIO3F2]
MEEDKAFKWVWRFNAVVIFSTGILAIVVLLIGIFYIVRNVTRDRQISGSINVEENSEIEEQWQLGGLQTIPGTTYVLAPLYFDQQYDQSFYEKTADSIRNYLFVNSQTTLEHWLLDTNDYLVTSIDILSSEEVENGLEKQKTSGILYQLIKADTSEDNRIDYQDLKTLALSQPDGKGYTEVVEDVDTLIGHYLNPDGTLLVIYQKEETGYSVSIDLSNFTVVEETELSTVE